MKTWQMATLLPLFVFIAQCGLADPAPFPQSSAQTIRDMAKRLESRKVASYSETVSNCGETLSNVASQLDPSYDPDIELEIRRRIEQTNRTKTSAKDAYVSWKEVSQWTPTNQVQLAIRSLSLAAAKKLHLAAGADLKRENEAITSMQLDARMARLIQSDLLYLHFKDAWMKDFGTMDSIGAAYKELFESVRDPAEKMALCARMVRRAAALKTDWTKYRDIRGLSPWMETSRRDLVHDCATDSNGIRGCLVTWMRVAVLAQNYRRLAEETKDVIVEMNRVLDEEGKMIRSEKVPFYAVVFSTMYQLLGLDFMESGINGIRGQPYPVVEAFVKESALLLSVKAGDDYKEYLRSIDGMVSIDKNNPQGIREYLAREDIRNGVVKKPAMVETPDPGRFEPYPASDELKQQLARYGFEAGVFVQAAFRQPGKTNRVSYVIHTPKNASGKVPVLLFLPGIGEIGNDLSKLFRQRTIFDKVTSAEFQKKHPCYLVAISPPDGTKTLSGYDGDGDPTPLQRTIHDALLGIARTRKHPAVDENRIYVTGLSFGGTGAYALPFVYPGFFAASVPVSAHIFPAKRLGKVLPCDFFHLYNEGELRSRPDDVSRLEGFGVRVRELGGDFRIGTFPNEGHNAWDAAWRDEAVWDWMFSKRRGANGAAARATGRVPDPTRSIGGGEENHAENAGSAEVRPPAVTASKPGRDGRTGPERAADGLDGTAYVSASPVSAGDWLQVEWSAPVQGRIEVRTGLPDGTLRLSKGRVEVSVDGHVWSRTGTVSQKTGVCAFGQRTGIRFLRLIPEPRVPEPLAVREIAVKP